MNGCSKAFLSASTTHFLIATIVLPFINSIVQAHFKSFFYDYYSTAGFFLSNLAPFARLFFNSAFNKSFGVSWKQQMRDLVLTPSYHLHRCGVGSKLAADTLSCLRLNQALLSGCWLHFYSGKVRVNFSKGRLPFSCWMGNGTWLLFHTKPPHFVKVLFQTFMTAILNLLANAFPYPAEGEWVRIAD